MSHKYKLTKVNIDTGVLTRIEPTLGYNGIFRNTNVENISFWIGYCTGYQVGGESYMRIMLFYLQF